MKDLKEIQEFVRKKVIMVAHPQCKTLEEALEKEIDFEDCEYISSFKINGWPKIDRIIGRPITLARVLNAVDKADNNKTWGIQKNITYLIDELSWKFLNNDGTECTFEQQNEEIQLSIAKLLGYEN